MMYLPNLESSFQFLVNKPETEIIEMQDLVNKGVPTLDSSFWETLHNILNRSWFKRLWVVQEIALSRSSFVMVGDRILRFRWVACAIRMLSELYWPTMNNIIVVAKFCLNILCFHSKTSGFLGKSVPDRRFTSLSARTHLVLTTLREHEVSNAADRVHGMMGMFKHKFVKRIATNANSTVAETYESFAVASLLADRRLSLLHHVSPTPAVTGLPSWCPI